jgi:hypothetical protein
MIVVADSGPLHYLILLQHIELLRRWRAHHDARVDHGAAHLG